MEFKIIRETFLEALAKAQSVCEKKTTMPILANVLLEAEKDGLRVVATNMDITLATRCLAQTVKPGKITLAARSLHDIIREMSQKEILVTLGENDRVEIKGGKSVFKIPGLTAKEFPPFPKTEGEFVSLPGDVFSGMIEKTSFCMATDETRPHLAGLLIEKMGKTLKLVATDGHRLSVCERSIGANLPSSRVILPRRGVSELKKIVAGEGNFDFSIGTKNVLVRKGESELALRLIDGEYPDYTRVIPEASGKPAVAPREKLVGALRRVSLVANERSRGIMMQFTSGVLEVFTSSAELGEAREEMEMDYKGPKISAGYNARYMLDALSVLEEDSVILMPGDGVTPCVIKTPEDTGFFHVVMPMRM